MEQLILHLIGDYVTQSDWMAQNKTKRWFPAFCHALVYSLPFLFIGSWQAVAVIGVTHYLIDRYRLARLVVYLKNIALQPAPKYNEFGAEPAYDSHRKKWAWSNCSGTGYPAESPAWLSVWLLIAADNTLHLAINFLSIRYL